MNAALDGKKSPIGYDHGDLTKSVILCKRIYSNILANINADHSKQEELRKLESSEVTLMTISFDPSNDKINQITHPRKRIIVFESDKEYMTHTLFEKDMELEKLHEKVKSLNISADFLESFIQEKEDLILALGEKLFKCQEELAHFFSIFCKLILGAQNLDEILYSTRAIREN